MATILPVRGKHPQWGANCFLAPNATVVGDVVMGDDCSIWFNAVLRGDVNLIRMGHKVNVQDGACIHGTFEKCGTTIGNNVSIGHNAIVHGCTLHDNVLIGMGAIVMDKAVVHSKKVKNISGELIEGEIHRIAENYVRYSAWFTNPDTTTL
jgi:carbonic anhydrase/acetyltransferase-like protein (isoleucine patch superfamily)